MDFARIGAIAAGECERQQVGFDEYVNLLNAYRWAYDADNDAPLHPNYIYMLANIIEPSKNVLGRYRQTPVTFANGGCAVDWDLIPNAMSQWFDMVNDPNDNLIMRGTGMQEYIVKEFLRIHPFRDGNGRLAWILRTRFYDNWGYPDLLPKYFPGE